MHQLPPQRPRHFSKRGQLFLALALVFFLLLAGLLYAQRYQIYQFVRALQVQPQAVHVTPLTLTPGTATTAHTTTPVLGNGSDWGTYHADPARSGFLPGIPDPTHLSQRWRDQLDGAVYAAPLVVAGKVIVATENNSLFALNAVNGQIQWHTSVGKPVPLSSLPCGDIDPLGITGTPVYDAQTGLIFAVAEIQGPAHVLVGLDAQTGQVKVRRLVDPAGSDPQVQQERGALALHGGRIYIAFGGLDGDCGDYHGFVVATRTDGMGPLLSYQVPSPREGGIWTPPGPVIDKQGNVYVAVGNGAITQGNWDHSDSILRLSPTLQLEDGFAPQSWQDDNATDADLGSMGPVLLSDGLLFAHGKTGQGYLLNANHLGGIGGQLQTFSPCGSGSYGGAAVRGRSIFIPCSNGLSEAKLGTGANLSPGWQAPQQVKGSPVVGGNTVYSLDSAAGVLYALDATTGSVRATIAVGAVNRFATPSLAQKSIFVGTLTGVVAVGIE